ncbi:uncharacterized protein LOC111709218 isoform X2 [Eurytemora carolleeae]|uniref:uncharacterized protein LOC111709218 isoform X2 n=1 Tax=Eurytemora carolleeae TaxID=1294199 RepID=UPI000C77D0B4|nr:uncharacterized protein LOC111709218 isoform X2 [Eurytemora carolleeae]XP_023338604.1 uncharacterized protein LOC111709218 isoform X2 [Eurytemora carolleeae]|eukprot:XP_023338603.1 uncharacterized protein LOC111709218 isoform X2 [Eurytemora affinis]
MECKEKCELCPDELSNGYKGIGLNTDGMFFYTASKEEDVKIFEAMTNCPDTHPFPFAGGLKCCERNLANPANIPSGSRGYLTPASTTCLGSEFVCPGSKCSRNQAYNDLTALQILTANLGGASLVQEIRSVESATVCQQYCESHTQCMGWAWTWPTNIGYTNACLLLTNSNMYFIYSSSYKMTAGFKSSIIVWN